MKKFLIALSATALAGLFSNAQTVAPLWLRNPAISPDGTTVAFTFNGDVYTVDATGGNARQITSSAAFDSYPVWSPDGKSLAFASDREGSFDLYIVNADGGTPRRITTNSASEIPLAFLNDSTVLFSTSLQPAATAASPGILQQVYAVSTKGTRPHVFASVPMGAVSVDTKGRILYHDRKGLEDPLRKHERSSGTADIWLIDNGKYTKLTSFNGHDMNPVWIQGTDQFYYVSEADGTLNVYRRGIDGTQQQLTQLKRHPVRSLSASADGKRLAFSYDGELYTLTPGSEPQKIDITIVADDYDKDLLKGYRTSGATNMAVSPSGDEVAFVLRGDIYVTSTKYGTTKRITNTDGQERCLSFAPDGRSIVYDSERDGKWQIYITSLTNPDEKNFTYATEFEETPLVVSEYTSQQPEFSPDGKKVAFLENRDCLKVIDVKTKEVNTALGGEFNYSYSDGDVPFVWSPDSRWLLTSYIGKGGWNNVDIALVKADGTEVVDLTQSGYSDSNPKWVLGGKGIAYTSGRYGYRSHGSWGEEEDVLLMMLDGEAWDNFNLTEEEAELKEKAEEKTDDKDKKDKDTKKDEKGKKGKKDSKEADKEEVKPLEFDLDNRFHRTARLTRGSSHMSDYWLSKKGDKLYYIAQATEGGLNLFVIDLKKGETKLLVSGIGRGGIIPDKKGENLFVLSGSGMAKIELPSGTKKAITFEAPYSRHPSAERAYMFDHAVQQVKDKFYDVNLHGVDWDQYAADYRRFLPYINNNYDFATLLSELLGELNASHTGGRYYSPGAYMPTASLGFFEDETYDGDGVKVAEVMARGPLSTKKADVTAGDIIISIDGDSILAGTDYYPLLEGKAGKKVRLGIQKANGDMKYINVKPISGVRPLLYERWVERNEAIVDSISGGKIGYVHIKGMDSDSYRNVYSKLLGKYADCDAVVVDTRYNGGGWLHNDIAVLLNGKEYVKYSPRGHYIGKDPFQQWTKPSVMLVNEANYSDAHGTPYVYQTLNIGKIVGAPIPGTMTAVWWENQIDPSIVFGIPQVTSLDTNGKPLENQQLNPDIEVYNNPADMEQGIDTQLIEAVKALMAK